ncbi:hypothetical protein FGG79_15430 [Bacillus sp. BHET2]|uniref:hypothetical protein n=1 Tax=Bacillus sp. BHET2 TaxID=2583818 RepID=UPI00110E8651|nr:hypothetical protein [Bacillus sp. BHET2]TMU84285.1 hypothetical protein FGG79_15430 [Bacillus sp. BHET2]
MDQVLQAIKELQGHLTRFENNMDERMTRLENRMDKLESRMNVLEENQQDTQDNIAILVKENWDHKKELHKVMRRVGMEQ